MWMSNIPSFVPSGFSASSGAPPDRRLPGALEQVHTPELSRDRSSARAEPMGVAITIAALCLWQPQPRPPRAASRRRAPTPLLCTDASSDWRRRDLLRAAAVSALTAGGLSVGPAFAAAPPAETVPQIEALVWRSTAASAGSAAPRCSAASVRTAFGPKFINYLSRFLLSYDVPSRRLWRARAAEIPLAWNKKQAVDPNPNPNPKP